MSEKKSLILITSTRGAVGKSSLAKNLASYMETPVVVHVESVNSDSIPRGVHGAIVHSDPELSSLITLLRENEDQDVIVDFGASMQLAATAYADDLSSLAVMADVVIIPTGASEAGVIDAREAINLMMERFEIMPERMLVVINRVPVEKFKRAPTNAALAAIAAIRAQCADLGVAVAETTLLDCPIISSTHSTDAVIREIASETRMSMAEIAALGDAKQQKIELDRRTEAKKAADAELNIRAFVDEVGRMMHSSPFRF